MARTRYIRPDFFKDSKVAKLSLFERLLFIGLWTEMDCHGLCEREPALLRAALFPLDEKISVEQVEKALGTIERLGFIKTYKFKEKTYLQCINFKKHQMPHMKEKSKFGFDAEYLINAVSCEAKASSPGNSGPSPENSGLSPGNSGLSPENSRSNLNLNLNLNLNGEPEPGKIRAQENPPQVSGGSPPQAPAQQKDLKQIQGGQDVLDDLLKEFARSFNDDFVRSEVEKMKAYYSSQNKPLTLGLGRLWMQNEFTQKSWKKFYDREDQFLKRIENAYEKHFPGTRARMEAYEKKLLAQREAQNATNS